MQTPAVILLCLAALPAVLADSATCGSTQYSPGEVSDAVDAACQLVQTGDTAGSSSYPHVYRNYEDFEFKGLSGPFYEFPILTTRVYSGGSPGADRVVITEDCTEAGLITHRGASGNSFVGCAVDEPDSTEPDTPQSSDEPGAASCLARPVQSAMGLALAAMSYVLFA